MSAFNIDPKLLLCLYHSMIEPLITYCSTCYYLAALSIGNRTRLLKISHTAAKIIGLPTPMLSQMIDHAILKKARAVTAESDHPLFTNFHVLPSQRRYRCIKCKTAHYSRSFVPVAIRMLNQWYWCQQVCFLCGYILHFICILWQSFFTYFRCDHEYILFKDIKLNLISERNLRKTVSCGNFLQITLTNVDKVQL